MLWEYVKMYENYKVVGLREKKYEVEVY